MRFSARQAPSWVPPNCSFALDFANGRGYNCSIDPAISGSTTYQNYVIQGVAGTTISNGGVDIYGTVHLFNNGAARIVPGYGLLIDSNTTNFVLQASDFTNAAWVKTNITAVKNQTGPDLILNSASLLTATSASATALQSVTVTSGTYIPSIFIRAVTVTGVISITIDNVTYTDISSNLVTGKWVRVSAPTVSSLTAMMFGVQIANSGDSIAVYCAQGENNAYPTGPLLTTTATSNRGAEEPVLADVSGTKPNDGRRLLRDTMCTGGPWAMLAVYSGTPTVSNGWLMSSDGPLFMAGGASGGPCQFQSNSVTATSVSSGNAGQGNYNKAMGRANGKGVSVCLNNGGIGTTNNAAACMPKTTAITHNGVGNNGSGNGAGPLGGNIKALYFWADDVPDGYLTNFTDPSSPY